MCSYSQSASACAFLPSKDLLGLPLAFLHVAIKHFFCPSKHKICLMHLHDAAMQPHKIFLLVGHALSLPQVFVPESPAPPNITINDSLNAHSPLYNATALHYNPWPQVPFHENVAWQPTSKLYFTYAGNFGTEAVSTSVKHMFQRAYDKLVQEPQRPGPTTLNIRSEDCPITFRCQNRKTGTIDWSYHYVLDFLRTMMKLLDMHQARYLELDVLNRRGYEDIKIAECELLGFEPSRHAEQIAVD